MISGKTKEGFEWSIPEEALDDWEIIELTEDISEGKQVTSKLCEHIFGKEQYKKLKEFYRDPISKRIKATKMIEVVTELFENIQKLKNL